MMGWENLVYLAIVALLLLAGYTGFRGINNWLAKRKNKDG